MRVRSANALTTAQSAHASFLSRATHGTAESGGFDGFQLKEP